MKSSRSVLFVDQRPVTPCDPPAAWLGGKRNLAKRICAVLAGTPHLAYVEPFIGMGGVFLRRPVRPQVEVINDLNGDIVTLFRVLQRFPEALFSELRWRPAIRSEFDRLKEVRDCDLLDIERAARFITSRPWPSAARCRARISVSAQGLRTTSTWPGSSLACAGFTRASPAS